MRKTLLLLVAAAAVSLFAGCKDDEPAATEAPKTAEVAKKTAAPEDAIAKEKADDAAEKAKAAAAEAEKKSALEAFEADLASAGFPPKGVSDLLPDKLGGLAECAATNRTKISLAKGYATMATFADGKSAEACLSAFLKMPGADKYKDLYLQKSSYILELKPGMTADDIAKIKGVFAQATEG